ncbi:MULTISPECIES: peptidylprolyl isomerase [unclassified Arthrobacter]|uniref:peptidylprolyl isomerase n=1 Tax=unclassified Arthrobacter TaxID=235627 RepID=UPI00159E654C|nr:MULTISPECIES: peptidylprolyl isomerase [unclassified Arthrobacter]MCQ9164359.1 peptidylprolyl isomerase [Arthrobacter sp. STN4]NVM97903.1 peptidylprolyl isomerase [Arthrobacter sp. SDTb3-6]
MANNKKDGREARARMARLAANRQMHQDQLARRKRDNIIAAAAMAVAIAVAVVLALTVFSGPKNDSVATNTPTAGASPTAAGTNSPTVPKAATAAGKTFTGTLTLNGQPMGVEIDGTKAPQAAAVFKSLADSNFFKGKTCHRLTDSSNFALLQCGSLNGDGAGDPNYQWGPVENSPANGLYPAGSIAVARGASTYSNGTQFFITYKDTTLPQTDGGYTLMGKVTSGLDVVEKIAAGGITPGASGAGDGAPKTKVTIDSFTLK